MKRYDYTSISGVNISQTDGNVFYNLSSTNYGYVTYNIFVDGRQNLYFDCFRNLSTSLVEPINNSFKIMVNDFTIKTNYPVKNTNGILDLGVFENETVTVSVCVQKSSYANSFGVFGIDLNELQYGIESIQPAEISIKGDVITANAIAKTDNNVLMLTIPYSKGFSVKVNGKSVKAGKILDAFMTIPLEKGNNVIKLKYRNNFV